VLIITGFGDEDLEAKALAELNTGFLGKPFEIHELVEALKALKPGGTTLKDEDAEDLSSEIREVMSSYISLRIGEPARDLEIYRVLIDSPGVVSCDAVKSDVDMICVLQASSEEEMKVHHERIGAIPGLEIVSTSRVERPELDRDLHEFVEIYRKAVKESALSSLSKPAYSKSYVIVDIDKSFTQQVFTGMFFLDELLICDMVDDGDTLIGLVTQAGGPGQGTSVLEKLRQIDGVRSVKEAGILTLTEM
jgi:hypothetical protein